jgi:aryl-alcohol dehydrogenase-like predicted oxidoreductase
VWTTLIYFTGQFLELIEGSSERDGLLRLLHSHRVDKKTPIEKTMQAMVELKECVLSSLHPSIHPSLLIHSFYHYDRQGKIKYIGLSEVSAATIRRACAVAHVDAVQMEYSPFSLEVEQFGVLDACRELGVALVAYSPLGEFFLAFPISDLGVNIELTLSIE